MPCREAADARTLVAFVAVGALAAGGPGAAGAGPPTGAGGFIKAVVGQIVSNDYEHAWLSLHPAQQQLVPQADYVACELQTPVAGRLVSIKIVRVTSVRFPVGGVAGRAVGKVVTLRIKLAADAPGP